MKILFVNDACSWGGILTCLECLEKELERKKIKAFFFYLSDGSSKLPEKDNFFLYPFRKYGAGIENLVKYNYFDFDLYNSLRDYIKKINPDIIHLHGIWASPYTILRACRGYKVVQTFHDYHIVCPTGWCVKKSDFTVCKGGAGLKCIKNSCINFPNYLFSCKLSLVNVNTLNKYVCRFICPSQRLKNYAEKYGFRNVIHLPNFIDTNIWKQKSKRNISNNILYSGRLGKEKGIPWLIKAFEMVLKKIPSARLIIAGDGPERKSLELLSQKLGLDKSIVFKGRLPGEEIRKLYKTSCMTVAPSIWMDQFPTTIIESLAMETPVIGSNIGGIPELIKDDIDGFLVERFDEKALAEKIIFLLKHKKIALKMGQEGRKIAEKEFDAQNNIDKLIRIYESFKNWRQKNKIIE